MAFGYEKDSTLNAELLNLTPQNLYRAPKHVVSSQTLRLREGPRRGGGLCWFWLLITLTALVEEGEGVQAVKKRLHLTFLWPPWCALFQKSLELGCGTKVCWFSKLAAIADLMGCNGLLSAPEGGWADAAHGPPNIPHHFSPGNFILLWMEV